MDGLGCTPPELKRSLPPSLPPSVFVIGDIRHDFDALSPSIQAGKTATRPPEPPWLPPPKLRGLGWIWAVGKTAHFAGTEALSPVTPHGDRAWGAGWPNQTCTHAPAARLREKASSADPVLATQTETVFPWRVRQCL